MNELLPALVATLTALGVVIWSGVTHRRSLHYGAVVALLACLGLAIWYAERLGSKLEFVGAAGTVHSIHMGAVVATFLALPVVAWTGIRLARGVKGTGDVAKVRAGHRHSATLFVVLMLVTSVLGALMTWLAIVDVG